MQRRKYLAVAGGTALAATTLASIPQESAGASVSMDGLNVQDNDKTLNSAPSSVTLEVTGQYELQGTTPDQSRLVLQLEHNSTTREPDEILNHSEGIMSGSYTLTGDVLAHPEIDASSLMPVNAGETKTTEITVRVVLLAVSGGEIQNETFVEDTATLSLSKNGVELAVSGSGGLTVTA